MQIVYATQRVPNMDGRVFKNPRNFLEPDPKATKVYIDGDWPLVREAYEKLSIPVDDVSNMKALPAKAEASPQK